MMSDSKFHAYIIGQTHCMHKEFSKAEDAFNSLRELQQVPHSERVLFAVFEGELTAEDEAIIMSVVQNY